jgi:replicative DNA helicase
MRYQAELQEKYKKGRVKYLDWGIDYLTEVLDSELGDFVVIGGYPSAGKTLLSLQCARRIAEQHRVGYFSFETGSRKLTQRLLTAASGVPLRRMKHNDLANSDYTALSKGIETLYALPFSIVEAAGMTVSEIQAVTLAERFKVIFVDYLQLVNQSGSSRYEKVTEISQQLHRLAQEHGVLVVALAQLSRPEKASKDSKPTPPGMSSLRESGQIEQDADAIALLYPENPNDRKSLRVLKIAKNKEGEPVNPCKLELRGEVQLFEEQFTERPRPAYDSSKKKPGRDDGQESLPL